MSVHIFTCSAGWEERLAAELARVFPTGIVRPLQERWVELTTESDGGPAIPCIALANQCMPDANALTAVSVGGWSKLLELVVTTRLVTHDGPWRLHTFFPGAGTKPARTGRAALISDGVRRALGSAADTCATVGSPIRRRGRPPTPVQTASLRQRQVFSRSVGRTIGGAGVGARRVYPRRMAELPLDPRRRACT